VNDFQIEASREFPREGRRKLGIEPELHGPDQAATVG
jgi:hypothetical protein